LKHWSDLLAGHGATLAVRDKDDRLERWPFQS
jgi:hypothetical protein